MMNSSAKYSTIASWALVIAKALDSYDVSSENIFSEIGIDLGRIKQNPDLRIPIIQMTALWQKSLSLTQDPEFGLRVAEQASLQDFRILGSLMLTSRNLEQAFRKLVAYHSMISNTAKVVLHRKPDQIGIEITPLLTIDVSTFAIDAFMASMIFLIRDMSENAQLDIDCSLDLVRNRPFNINKWKAIFGNQIQFESTANILWLHKHQLVQSVPAAHISLNETDIENRVLDDLDKRQLHSLSSRVEYLIHGILMDELPTLKQVADILCISDRTIERHLKKEGTSFRALLLNKQIEIACHYLDNTQLSINDIAQKLGFSYQANFSRSFKSMMLLSPKEYRQRQC